MAFPPIIPASTSTVNVSVIDSSNWALKVPCGDLFKPKYKGLETFDLCSYSFLISNEEGDSARHVLFDLGIRKDWQNLPPPMPTRFGEWGTELKVEKHVSEVLQESHFDLRNIEAIIWSHLHWDHTGAPALFPPTTKLIVGPGIAEKYMPGWPSVPSADFLEKDTTGRPIQGLEHGDFTLNVGGFKAVDYFGDGSFYILDAPGHSFGHLNALARTSSNPDTFIFLAADSVHLGGEFRPTDRLPLPDPIDVPGIQPRPCPAEELVRVHPSRSKTTPFLGLDPSFPSQLHEAEETIKLIQAFDADNRVFVVFSHDISIFDVLEFYPANANDWKAKGWKDKGLWTFLTEIQKLTSKKVALKEEL